MSSSYVCQTCRRELRRQLHRRRQLQWPSQRTFISFNDIVPPQETDAPPPSKKIDARAIRRQNWGHDIDAQDENGKAKELGEDKHDAKAAAPGRYSKYGSAQSQQPSADFEPLAVDSKNLRAFAASRRTRGLDSLTPLEAANLIPNVPEETFYKPTRRKEPAPAIASRAQESRQDGPAVSLWMMLSSSEPSAKEAWDYFREHYVTPGQEGAALRRPSARDRTIIREHKLFRELLRTVSTQWEPGSTTLPSPSEVVECLQEFGIMGQGWYLLEILQLNYRLLRLPQKAENEIEMTEEQETRLILEEQMLLLWSNFFRFCPSEWMTEKGIRLKSGKQQGSKIDWTGLPDIEKLHFSKRMGSDAYRFSFRLYRMFTGVPAASTQHLAVAALLSFDYFAKRYCHANATPDERIPYEHLVRLLLHTMHGAQDTEIAAALATSLVADNNVPEDTVQALEQRLSNVRHRAALALAIEDLHVLGSASVNFTDEQENKLIGYYHGRIKKQIERKNRGVIDQLWQEALLAYGAVSSIPEPAASSDIEENKPLIPPKIYSAFLFGYRDLKEPERQTAVWNHMLASGMTPTHEQWGLMISARMRHLNSMEHIWTQMQASGTPPDHQTWCTRLSGHIYYGNPEEGIQLLYEWANRWFKEISQSFEESGVDLPPMDRLNRNGRTIPRPNTDTLTTVITALVQRKQGRGRRLDLVPDAFAWAQTFGVKPNLWTYNTLFRTCLKDGNLKEAMLILKKMEEDKITPDAYTFYGFADFVFRQSQQAGVGAAAGKMGAEEQYLLIFNILDMLQQRGLEPNTVFFGSMIDSLLKTGGKATEPNLPAAMMLLRMMLEKNVSVPSHIWTSLMTYHFQAAASAPAGTPDWNAIESLWRTINSSQYVGLDAMFYDRMIEGFASFGVVDKAVTMLERMGREGKKPGWQPLTALVRAYLRMNMEDAARGLVRDAASNSGLLKEGVRTPGEAKLNPARRKFFEVAVEHGLIGEGEVDMKAVREYRVASEDGAMRMPMGVTEGYGRQAKFGSKASAPRWSGEEEADGERVQSMEEIEKAFSSQMSLMPGSWEEVVEQPSRGGRRR